MPKLDKFEQWVKDNYVGQKMTDPPNDLDSSKEVYYIIDGLHYGPIPWEKIPTEFMENK